jgi:predicted nucleic acid-binding protein
MVYLDTSALLKRYIPEAQSDAFESFLQGCVPATISRLTFVEVRSALARIRRENRIDSDREQAAAAALRNDVLDGLLKVAPATDRHFMDAMHLIERLTALPLRTLDALHLALAQDMGAQAIATADDTMAKAAVQLNLEVVFFGKTS